MPSGDVDVSGVQIPAPLQDFVHKGRFIRMAIGHSFQCPNFVIEAVRYSCCELRFNVGFNIEPVPPYGFDKLAEWLQSRFSD